MIDGLRFCFTREYLVSHVQIRIEARVAALQQNRDDLAILQEKAKRYYGYESLCVENENAIKLMKAKISQLSDVLAYHYIIKDHFHDDDYSLSVNDMRDIELIA